MMLFSISSYFIAQAQFVSSGWYNAAAITNLTGAGTLAWSNLLNASTNNDTAATAGTTLSALATTNTKFIGVSAFGVAIPAGAVIHGIQVDIKRKATGLLVGSSIKDYKVQIIKNGTITGTNMAATTAWPTTYGTATYGGETSDWGETWTRDDMLSTNFGVAVAAKLNAGVASLTLTAHIDQIRLSVYYDIPVPLPVELVSFNAVSKDNTTVQLNWLTALEINNDFFGIEKSDDAVSWNTIANIQGVGNSTIMQQYSYTDKNPATGANYYRLRQCDYDGTCKYSDVAMVNVSNVKSSINIQADSRGTVLIEGGDNAKPALVTLYNISGMIQYSCYVYSNTPYQMKIDNLPSGIYILSACDNNKLVSRKIYLN